MKFLRAALEKMSPRLFLPRHGYAYYNERKKKSLTTAVKEMALLSHVFTKAVEWGVVDANPCREIRKQKPEPHERYVEDWGYEIVHEAMPPMIRAAVDLTHLTGLRPGDLLRSNFVT